MMASIDKAGRVVIPKELRDELGLTPESVLTLGSPVDTNVAVAALDAAHGSHSECLAAVRQLRPALAGHAAFETFSVLTRMPGQLAVDGPTAATIIQRVFPDVA